MIPILIYIFIINYEDRLGLQQQFNGFRAIYDIGFMYFHGPKLKHYIFKGFSQTENDLQSH